MWHVGTEQDRAFMRHAVMLAMRGRGAVEPNPMVGCVIVRDGRIIAQGWHAQFGGPHAERMALDACQGPSAGATAYVTLEPCCHVQKKTPPCVPALIQAGLARIVVGCADPNPQVNGLGIAQLREAGITVDAPVLEETCKQLIAPFLARILHHRPYVTLKWAQTADGKVAGPGGRRMQISNPTSMAVMQQILRAGCDAMLVGINTVLNDDPVLRAPRPLTRIVLDTNLRIPPEAAILEATAAAPGAGGGQRLRIYCSQIAISQRADRAEMLRAIGVELIAAAPRTDGRIALEKVLRDDPSITHLLVEPGPTLAHSFVRENLVDRLWIFQSRDALGDKTAPSALPLPGDYRLAGEIGLRGDVLREYLNTASDVFFQCEPSAEFLRARQSQASELNA